ncbi:hypothetical protein QUA20_26470 [Microcoleus sp. Pol7_A1]|uniref:hypothetical protein n=1 Tax=unclassified Microcoleus TaxID=2642155 RepID=UPI002FD0B3CE
MATKKTNWVNSGSIEYPEVFSVGAFNSDSGENVHYIDRYYYLVKVLKLCGCKISLHDTPAG